MSSGAAPSRPSGDRRTSAIQKRQSILPKPASIVLDPSVIIAQHAQLTGTQPITIGPNAVLHPHSRISSTLAPVVLGEGVVIYERAKVGVGIGNGTDASLRRSSTASARDSIRSTRGEGTVLERHVVIETGAIVEAAEIGEGSLVEAGAVLGRGCVIGKYCTITSGTIIPGSTSLPDYTVVYGGTQHRIDQTLKARPELQQARLIMHEKQLEVFKKLITNHIAKWM
ncbi:trimeric LpxA-like protein [Aaosphaeria arxii CBS 175.79]|uniref:Dynactin subunit 6 n=1 Tax=Aaosphaeria arxii CBS 175.79 TaxID=1450172 RepID=A0A6A5Y645_9PLEO|nr:trimeric LpxA-like protein [Aaosphaeria arxii CBS 175.79]KAF2020507.1 trimeric LpxA-like protein [Aaosphaeria arxii CBS 175.79]